MSRAFLFLVSTRAAQGWIIVPTCMDPKDAADYSISVFATVRPTRIRSASAPAPLPCTRRAAPVRLWSKIKKSGGLGVMPYRFDMRALLIGTYVCV